MNCPFYTAVVVRMKQKAPPNIHFLFHQFIKVFANPNTVRQVEKCTAISKTVLYIDFEPICRAVNDPISQWVHKRHTESDRAD